VMGCSHTHGAARWSIFHCSECDDFPMPSYGPNSMPGTYSGPQVQGPSQSSRIVTPPSSNAPAPNEEAAVPPPDERPTTPPPAPPADTGLPTSPTPPPAGNR
jgi:hypothetical protein